MSNEENLQEQISSGKSDGSRDAIAYEKVFRVLKNDTTPPLSTDFADRVVTIVVKQSTSRFSALEITLAIIGGLFSIITFLIAIVLTGFKPELGFLDSLNGYKGVLFFGAGLIILLHWLDKLVVRKKQAL